MTLENFTCFGCGRKGHLERDCLDTELSELTRNTGWCGDCDRRTHLITIPGGQLARCQVCHPLRSKPLRQHGRCPDCDAQIREWDARPCGQHAPPHDPADRRPPREHIDRILAAQGARP